MQVNTELHISDMVKIIAVASKNSSVFGQCTFYNCVLAGSGLAAKRDDGILG